MKFNNDNHMKRKLKLAFYILPALVIFAGYSCKDMLTADAGEVLEYQDHYRNVYDADAAVLGIYGKFAALAENVIVLNELRADLMDVTPGASSDLRDLNNQTPGPFNKYANPAPFYNLINNCNEVITELTRMYAENRLRTDEYYERYADIGALRCYLYLQMGSHYGTIPYFTKPIRGTDDMVTLEQLGEQVFLPFNQVLDSLIDWFDALPSDKYMYAYSSNYGVGRSNQLSAKTLDNLVIENMFIEKRIMRALLHLTRGADAHDYERAAFWFNDELNVDKYGVVDGETNYRAKLHNWVWDLSNTYPVQCHFIIQLRRNNNVGESYQNSTAIYNSWIEMFRRKLDVYTRTNNVNTPEELLWVIPYHKDYVPKFSLIQLMSKEYGDYQVRPSQWAIDGFFGSGKFAEPNNTPGDLRGPTSAWKYVNDDPNTPQIMKFQYQYDVTMTHNPLDRGTDYELGRWTTWRAPYVHLLFAEAANRAEALFGHPDTYGLNKFALALLNTGLSNGVYTACDSFRSVDPVTGSVLVKAPVYSLKRNSTVGRFEEEAFWFNAKNDSDRDGTANYFARTPWRSCNGVRGRVNQEAVTLEAMAAYPSVFSYIPVEDRSDSVLWVEDALLKEMGLEGAYEGTRWLDIIRIARHREAVHPGSGGAMMERILRPKYTHSASGATAPDFTNPDNWYLPFPVR